jgi:hypothetical protein
MDIDYTGSYPIILGGETSGEITVAREGLFWRFSAQCEPRGELVRLSLYGDGREGYLGVMAPFGETLRLTKKLSRAALRDFPEHITHGAQHGETGPIEQRPAQPGTELRTEAEMPREQSETEYCIESPPSTNEKDIFADSAPSDMYKPPANEIFTPHDDFGRLRWRPCAVPCSLFGGLEEKTLCSLICGAFSAPAGEITYLAVPEARALTLPAEGPIRFRGEVEIDGNTCLICKIRDGRCATEL